MQPVQKISAPLKCMLLAFFFGACAQNEKIMPERVGYLTVDFDYEIKESSEFSGIMRRETKMTEPGKASLAVKVESDKGERIELIIYDYKKNSIYKIEEARFKEHWEVYPKGDSSGSLRYCASGRFFLNSDLNKATEFKLPELGSF